MSSTLHYRLKEYIEKSFETNYVRDWDGQQVLCWLKLIGLEGFIKAFNKIKGLSGQYLYANLLPLEEHEISFTFKFITKFGCLRKLHLQAIKLKNNLYHFDVDMVYLEVARCPQLISYKRTSGGSSGGSSSGGSMWSNLINSVDESDMFFNSVSSETSRMFSEDACSADSNNLNSYFDVKSLQASDVAVFIRQKKILTTKEHLTILTQHQIDGDVFVTMQSEQDWMILFIFHYKNVYLEPFELKKMETIYENHLQSLKTMPNLEQVKALKNVVEAISKRQK